MLTIRTAPEVAPGYLIPASGASQDMVSNMKPGEVYKFKELPKGKVRSIAQNNLLHMWLGEVAKHTGETKADEKDNAKKKYVHPILLRDDPGYAEMWVSIRAVDPEHRQALRQGVLKLIHTSDLKVKQFAEMLNEFERDWRMQGVNLTRPDDLYWEAMGNGGN